MLITLRLRSYRRSSVSASRSVGLLPWAIRAPGAEDSEQPKICGITARAGKCPDEEANSSRSCTTGTEMPHLLCYGTWHQMCANAPNVFQFVAKQQRLDIQMPLCHHCNARQQEPTRGKRAINGSWSWSWAPAVRAINRSCSWATMPTHLHRVQAQSQQ